MPKQINLPLPKTAGQIRYEKHRAGWKKTFPGIRIPMATWAQCSPFERDAWEQIAAKEAADNA